MKVMSFGGLTARITGGSDGEGAGDGPVVVLLHGFGAPGDDLVPLWRVLGAPQGTRFVFPAAPLDLGPMYMGGRAWWPIDFEDRMRRRMQNDHGERDIPPGLPEARTMLQALLAEVHTQLSPSKLVIGGFSQGSMLALDVALHDSIPLAGLVLLSTTQLAADERASRYGARRGLPVFMSHGRQDELLPFAVTDALRGVLEQHGMDVTWMPFVGGHGIPQEVLGGTSAFLQRVLAP